MAKVNLIENEKSIRIRNILKTITVEPLCFLVIFTDVFSYIAFMNIVLEKSCRVDLKYPQSVCDAMMIHNSSGFTQDEMFAVQKHAAFYQAIKTIIYNLCPPLLLIFIGSWSDRHQKRLIIIRLIMFADFLAAGGHLLSVYFFHEMSTIYNVIFASIPGFTGGLFCLMMISNCYISDISTVENRTFRVSLLNIITYMAVPFGAATSGIIYKSIGFYGTFGGVAIIILLCILYAWILLEEPDTKQYTCLAKDKTNWFVDFFHYKHVTQTFKVVFKSSMPIPLIIGGLILVFCGTGPITGENTVHYLFIRLKYGWSEIDYSLFQGGSLAIQMSASMFVLTLFSKKLQLNDFLIGTTAACSKFLGSLIYALAPTVAVYLSGAAVECLAPLTMSLVRSTFSKLSSPEDYGKLFSIYGVFEALTPLIIASVYTMVYGQTLETFPSAFYFLTTGFYVIVITIFLLFYFKYGHKLAKTEKSNVLLPDQKVPLSSTPNNESETIKQINMA